MRKIKIHLADYWNCRRRNADWLLSSRRNRVNRGTAQADTAVGVLDRIHDESFGSEIEKRRRKRKMKIVYCENIDMFFSGEYKKSFDLNFVMRGIGPDATVVLTDPEHSCCEAIISMKEICGAMSLEYFSRLDPDGLEIVDNGDEENMLYKPIHKGDIECFAFYAYDTKEKAEAAKERIREAIEFFNGGKEKRK